MIRRIAALVTAALAAVAFLLPVPAMATGAAWTFTDVGPRAELHWPSYTTYGPRARYVWVYDMTTDANLSSGLRSYISAMQNLWNSYPGFPYPIYVDHRADYPGFCTNFGDTSPGVIAVCNKTLPEIHAFCNDQQAFGCTPVHYQQNGSGRLYSPNVWIASGYSAATYYTAACHEMGHALGFAHSTNQGSCMAPSFSLDQVKGYDSDDIGIMFKVYYVDYPLPDAH